MKNKFIMKYAFRKYLSEIIVIFIGISISFWFEEWRDNRRDRETEHKILMNLRENLVQDTLMMGGNVKGGEIYVYSITQLISFKSKISSDSLNHFIDMATSYSVCLNNQTTYEEIKQTGRSTLIQDDSLKKAILGYYTVLIPYVREWCKVDENQTMTQLIPEMSNYFSVVIDSLNIISASEKMNALKMPKIRNILLTNKAYKNETVKTFKGAKNSAKKLIERIDKVLKK